MSDASHDDHPHSRQPELPNMPKAPSTPTSPPDDPAIDPARQPLHPIRCDCGRALIVRVDRNRALLRCPVHGVQFRYNAKT